jgi:phosphocarrier protein HPr
MVSKTLTVTNKTGLHLRPAGVLAKAASKCKAEVTIKFNGKAINAKSVIGIMSSAIKCGDEIVLECEGEDEERALTSVAEAIESGLGE